MIPNFAAVKGFKPIKPEMVQGQSLMICQDCLAVFPYDQAGHSEEYFCKCGGQLCGCGGCNADTYRAGLVMSIWGPHV